MENVLVVSDSHGDYSGLRNILQYHLKEIHRVVHLGDGYDEAISLASENPGLYFHMVCGNCDIAEIPEQLILNICGTRIFALHGHRHGVKTSYEKLCSVATEYEANLCLFGHTHTPTNFSHHNIEFINPGSVFNSGNYAIICLSYEHPPAIRLLKI